MLQTLDLDVVFDDDRPPGVSAFARPAVSKQLKLTPRGYLAPANLPGPWREWFEERAAIREYEGGQAREHA